MSTLITPLTPPDVPDLTELQPPDWGDIRPRMEYFLSSSFCNPLKIAENGKIAAVGTTICHLDSAWLAHIIVHPDFRGKGYGRQMAETLINSVDQTKITTIYLDATEMGFPLYQKLGFELEADYVHLVGDLITTGEEPSEYIVPFSPGYYTQVMGLDEVTSAEKRINVLRDHLSSAQLYVRDGQVLGAYFPTLFDKFIMASETEAGCELLKLRMRERNVAIFPSENRGAYNFLESSGYLLSKVSRRMRLGRHRGWKPEFIFNRISGGLG